MLELAGVFAIDIAAYAVMSNHYHIVVHIDGERAKKWTDESWFMRVLNESIARMANSEDECTGRFWEGRFKSQALLDEHALLTAMAYIDLNPIRAAMAETPEQSDHTSVQQRIHDSSMPMISSRNSAVRSARPICYSTWRLRGRAVPCGGFPLLGLYLTGSGLGGGV